MHARALQANRFLFPKLVLSYLTHFMVIFKNSRHVLFFIKRSFERPLFGLKRTKQFQMPGKGRSVILRSFRTRLIFKTGLKPTELQEGITFDLMQALNLRILCDLTVFAIPICLLYLWFIMTSCIITWHSCFISLTISKTKGIYLFPVLQIMASVHRNTI